MNKFLNKIDFLNENNKPYTFGEFRVKLNEEEIQIDDTEDSTPLFTEKDVAQIKHEIYGMLKGRNDTGVLYNVKQHTFEPETGIPSTVYVKTNNIADYELSFHEPLTNDPVEQFIEKISDWDISLTFVDKRPESDEEFEKELDHESMLPEPNIIAKSDRDVLNKSIARDKVEKKELAEPYQPLGPYLLWFDIDVVPTTAEKRNTAKKDDIFSTEKEERKAANKHAAAEEKELVKSDADMERAAIASAKKGDIPKFDFDNED